MSGHPKNDSLGSHFVVYCCVLLKTVFFLATSLKLANKGLPQCQWSNLAEHEQITGSVHSRTHIATTTTHPKYNRFWVYSVCYTEMEISFDEISVTDCTESCHFDNFRCSQWHKFRQNDNIIVSVYRMRWDYAPSWSMEKCVNSFRPLHALMFHAKPLPEPMLVHFQLDPSEQTLVKVSLKYSQLLSRKLIWKYRPRNVGHFLNGCWVSSINVTEDIPLVWPIIVIAYRNHYVW